MKGKSKKYRQRLQTKRGLKRYLSSLGRAGKVYTGSVASNSSGFDVNTSITRKPNTCIIDEYNLSSTLKFLFSNVNFFTNRSADIPKDGVLFVPEIFSLNANPGPSYKFLKDLMFTLRYPVYKRLRINYRKCTRIDLDAAVCSDIILREYIGCFRALDSRNIVLETTNIEVVEILNLSVKKFLFATGTHKIITNFKVDFNDIETYDLVIGDKRDGIAYKELNGTNMVRHIEKCLEKLELNLKQGAKERLGEIIGEVIANAEEHNITDYHYSIGHFEFDKTPNGRLGMFQLVIFNFGESIYERFNNPAACKNTGILNDLRARSKVFTDKKYFGIFGGNRFEEETLWTLYSLQDQVSSVGPTRGNGTIQFIESFFDLRNNDKEKASKLFLFSGNTRILFDGKYTTQYKPKAHPQDDDYKIITFNSSNSLNEKPDPEYVTFVENFFPGTMIYGKIAINNNDLEENEDRQN